MANRFMLAPLTNLQSHADGTLSDEEFHWLTMRARGGFGSTMTCAAHVQRIGQGFPGQLGVFGDEHREGLTRLASAINNHSVSLLQLHHAGIRSPHDLIGEAPVGPSADVDTGARELSTAEVEALTSDFVAAALRAQTAGFHGVELHGAHGYLLCAFISADTNRRTDRYGGSLENRSRLLFDCVAEIRRQCRPDFIVGVRLSPERFGMKLAEAKEVAQRLFDEAHIDFLDMSLWDCFKLPAEEEHGDRLLIEHFAQLDRGDVRLGVAGKLTTPADVARVMEFGVDFALLGRAAIIHHDFPNKMALDLDFVPLTLPVTADHLRAEGLSDKFLAYMGTWKGFILESTDA
jgi:2,4-dienoyl-CoA reductase-like NADH-dependent reductase (Old Yellow Enzyme family)